MSNLNSFGLIFFFFNQNVLSKKSSLLRYNLHTIQLTPLKWTIQWFLVYSVCNHRHHLMFLKFSSPARRNPIPISRHSLVSLPRAPATTNLFSVSTYSPLLDISYKLNHTVFVFLCLAYFTKHTVLKDHR